MDMRLSQAPEEERDDLDRLFSRVAYAAPPQGLSQRVLATVERRARRRQRLAYLLLGASLGVTTLICFWLGAALARSEVLGLIDFLLDDADDLLSDPFDALMAIAEATPMVEVAAVAVLVLMIAFIARVAVTSTFRSARPAVER